MNIDFQYNCAGVRLDEKGSLQFISFIPFIGDLSNRMQSNEDSKDYFTRDISIICILDIFTYFPSSLNHHCFYKLHIYTYTYKVEASFSYTAAHYFNALQSFIRELKSYLSFKRHRRLHILRHYSQHNLLILPGLS